jgi:RNA polymerase sigma-70 factor (sigma-E family)
VAGDEEFAEYASARWRTLLRSAVLLGCSVEEAEDLVQTTLLRCYLKWAKVSQAHNRDAYVSQVLINAHRASRRRRWWRERATAAVTDTAQPDSTTLVDGADAVSRALALLSQHQREVVVLRYFLHLSERQVADTLGIPPGTVKSRLSRALQRLSLNSDLAELHGGGTHE